MDFWSNFHQIVSWGSLIYGVYNYGQIYIICGQIENGIERSTINMLKHK